MEFKKIEGSKILFLCTTDNMIWQFLKPHIDDLIAMGGKVDCVASKTGFWFDELASQGYNMIDIPMKRKPLNMTNFRAYKALKKLHKKNKYDLIYCQQPTGGLLGRFLGKKYKIPVIYTAHGFFFFKGNSKLKNLIFKTAEKYMAKFTNILLTMNDEDFEATKNWKAKKKYKISGIGLDVNKYQEMNSKDLSKNDLGINEDDKVILSVSEFIPRKNYKTMLQVVAKLSQERNDIKYLLCGTGQQLEEMKSLAKELGIENIAKFLGYRKDIDKIMNISDIFYHQSFHEGLTMGIMEAMYYGLPVVASNARGNIDLISEEGGITTHPLDEESQLLALKKLANDETLRKQMGQFNKEKIERYSLASVRRELLEIYRENRLI